VSWFAQPDRVTAEVFTRLPDSFRKPTRSAWADANKGGEWIDSFLEGPSFDAQGNLYVTDIPHGRIFRICPKGRWSLVCQYDGWPNGLKFRPDGTAVIADYKNGLMQLEPDRGAATPLLSTAKSEGFRGLNDLFIARNGDIFFTDQGQTGMQDPTGRVYRLTHDGRLDRLLDTCPSPNGIALDVEEKHLFVALTRACQVWRMPVPADSVVCKVNVFAHTPGGVSGPDGLAVTTDNGLLIANPGHGCVWLLDRRGVPLLCVESAAGKTVTNLAFSPEDFQMLYITESETGQILRVRLPVSGQPLASHTKKESDGLPERPVA
jgi:gluconolactonase